MKSQTKGQHTGWYYIATTGHFGGFFWYDDRPKDSDAQELWGPYKTLSEAKKEAITYFKTDAILATLAIEEIRESAKWAKAKTGPQTKDVKAAK